jgi:SRSO17 transposase
LGKIENCQVGVFAVLSAGERHVPVNGRLYLPQRWVDEPARCRRAGIPEAAIRPCSKARHALEMVQQARVDGLRFGWVGLDGGYGKEPWLLRALAAAGETFLADVHKDQMVWLADPQPQVPAPNGRGRRPSKPQPQAAGITLQNWLSRQPCTAWRRIDLRAGTRGRAVQRFGIAMRASRWSSPARAAR